MAADLRQEHVVTGMWLLVRDPARPGGCAQVQVALVNRSIPVEPLSLRVLRVRRTAEPLAAPVPGRRTLQARPGHVPPRLPSPRRAGPVSVRRLRSILWQITG